MILDNDPPAAEPRGLSTGGHAVTHRFPRPVAGAVLGFTLCVTLSAHPAPAQSAEDAHTAVADTAAEVADTADTADSDASADTVADPGTPETVTAEDVKGLLDGLTEGVQAIESDVNKLKKLKISGYIQARMQWSQASADTVKANGSLTPANSDYFHIRRGRLKVTYDSSPLSQAVLYFDAGTDRTARLLEAYVTLLDPWTVLHGHSVTMGQFAVPFGYEVERSSSIRELPERSRAENVLFSGERDRGVKIVDNWTPKIQTVVAVLNGGGINNADFPNSDPTAAKDWTVRGRYVGGVVDAAVSYYKGRNLIPLTGADIVTDKKRFGADVQGYYQLPTLGGGSLKAEFYQGHDVNPDSTSALLTGGAATNPRLLKSGADAAHLATDVRGWYAMWVQNLGEKLQVAARHDAWDPNTDGEHDQYTRTSLALHYFYDGYTRLTVSYDAIKTEKKSGAVYADPKDNLLTVQLQHKF